MPMRLLQSVFGLRGVLLVAVVFLATAGALFWPAGRKDLRAQPSVAASSGRPATTRVQLPAEKPSPAVDVSRRAAGSVSRTITQPAHVEPFEQTEIYAKISGYVARVHVDLGDRVEKDQPLAELWVPEMQQERRQKQAALAEARAQLAHAKAAVTAAEEMVVAADAKVTEARAWLARHEANAEFRRIDHARYKRLEVSQTVPQEEVEEKLNLWRGAEATRDAARAAVNTAGANLKMEHAGRTQAESNAGLAEARIEVAKANLAQIDVMLDYAVVRAPFAGVITHRALHTGAFIPPPSSSRLVPLLTVARVDRLRIVTDVPETESTAIRIGQRAELVVDAGRRRKYAGTIARSADSLDPATRTLRVEIELDAPAAELRPGMYGSATLSLSDRSNPP
jgi:HlyD family secretion protein